MKETKGDGGVGVVLRAAFVGTCLSPVSAVGLRPNPGHALPSNMCNFPCHAITSAACPSLTLPRLPCPVAS